MNLNHTAREVFAKRNSFIEDLIDIVGRYEEAVPDSWDLVQIAEGLIDMEWINLDVG